MEQYNFDGWDCTLFAIVFVFFVFAGVPIPDAHKENQFIGGPAVHNDAAAPEPPSWRAVPRNPNWIEVAPGEYKYIVEP